MFNCFYWGILETIFLVLCTWLSCFPLLASTEAESLDRLPYRLVWEDAFEGEEIDPADWEHEEFPGVASGNNELQYYTKRKENCFIRNGCLVIQAIRERYLEHDYTSARIKTANKHDFRFGKIEARIKLPSSRGVWPAFWMLPSESIYGPWPLSGEIDIVESVNDAQQVHGTIHYGTPAHVYRGAAFPAKKGDPHVDFSNDFHVYTVLWEPDSIRWLIDGQEYGCQTEWSSAVEPFPAPFDQKFHLILNLAVGGYWPGPPDTTSVFPQELVVDWVRVYQVEHSDPEIRIITPEPDAHIQAGTVVSISAEASDPDGKVERVLFYMGKDLVAECLEPPYQVNLKNLKDGCYQLTSVALDGLGGVAKDSVRFTLGAGCPPRPFHGNPLEVPGRIEAEWFDEGIDGQAYHDTDNYNRGGAFRPQSGVDIERCNDGDHGLAWLEAGEWTDYSITVREAGLYRITAKIAAPESGGKFHIEFGKNQKDISAQVPGTGGWQIYKEFPVGEIHLVPGEQKMRLAVDHPGFNLSCIEIIK